MTRISVLTPVPVDPLAPTVRLAPRVALDTSSVLTLVDNGKPRARELLGLAAAELRTRLGFGEVEVFSKKSAAKPLTSEEAAHIAASATIALTGLGDCGACSACSINDAIQLEGLGVPTAAVVTEPFQALAASFAVRLGLPEVRTSVVPHPVASRSEAELLRLAAKMCDGLVVQLSDLGSAAADGDLQPVP